MSQAKTSPYFISRSLLSVFLYLLSCEGFAITTAGRETGWCFGLLFDRNRFCAWNFGWFHILKGKIKNKRPSFYSQQKGWCYCSVIGHLHSMNKVLGSIPSAKRETNTKSNNLNNFQLKINYHIIVNEKFFSTMALLKTNGFIASIYLLFWQCVCMFMS